MKLSVMTWNRFIVAAYKLLGFVILSGILVWLASYIFINLFFQFNRSWIAPTVISPIDENVRDLHAQLAEQLAQRDKLISQRHELVAKLEDTGRIVAAEMAFQANFHRALIADQRDRDATLTELQQLTKEYDSAKRDILKANKAYEKLSQQRLGQLYSAKLIDDDGMISANHQLAEMTGSNLSLKQKSVELDNMVSRLRREVSALASAANDGHGNLTLTYDILMARREYDRSVLEVERAAANQRALKDSLQALDQSIHRYDELADDIRRSPYLQAHEDFLIAFVPYQNMRHVETGEEIFSCDVGPFWCKKVGVVKEILDGEVVRKHPLHNKELRGKMVHIVLDDPVYAQEQVLHAGRAPFYF